MLIGYARSSVDEDLVAQRAALEAAGCHKVYQDDGGACPRWPLRSYAPPEFDRMLDALRNGDVVIVTRLDRLARSSKALLMLFERLNKMGASLRSMAEPWADTSASTVLTVVLGLAQFERSLTHERAKAGRDAARKRGVRLGRPPKITPGQVALARRLTDEGASVRAAATVLGCHYVTLYRALNAMRDEP